MKYSLISVVIVTLNSEKTLRLVLDSIKKQSYPEEKIEIIVVDGGSTDKTLEIARKYHCIVFPNPKVDFVSGKQIGYKMARGKVLLLLDSDEVLESHDSIKNKYLTMISNKKVKAVVSSGYKKPASYPSINTYINEYGDPFSLFMYNSSRDAGWFLPELVKNYQLIKEDQQSVVFDFGVGKTPPFIEFISMGVMIDLDFVKRRFPKILTSRPMHNHMFYLLIANGSQIAIMKDDPIIHYSAASFKVYLRKILSRVRNNIYENDMGQGGYKGREEYFPFSYKIKKLLFIPYSLSIIFPIVDSLRLYLTRKQVIYLAHPILCLYTLYLIMFYYFLKLSGVKNKVSGYGV